MARQSKMQQAVVGFAVAAMQAGGLSGCGLIGWLPALLFGWLALGPGFGRIDRQRPIGRNRSKRSYNRLTKTESANHIFAGQRRLNPSTATGCVATERGTIASAGRHRRRFQSGTFRLRHLHAVARLSDRRRTIHSASNTSLPTKQSRQQIQLSRARLCR